MTSECGRTERILRSSIAILVLLCIAKPLELWHQRWQNGVNLAGMIDLEPQTLPSVCGTVLLLAIAAAFAFAFDWLRPARLCLALTIVFWALMSTGGEEFLTSLNPALFLSAILILSVDGSWLRHLGFAVSLSTLLAEVTFFVAFAKQGKIPISLSTPPALGCIFVALGCALLFCAISRRSKALSFAACASSILGLVLHLAASIFSIYDILLVLLLTVAGGKVVVAPRSTRHSSYAAMTGLGMGIAVAAALQIHSAQRFFDFDLNYHGWSAALPMAGATSCAFDTLSGVPKNQIARTEASSALTNCNPELHLQAETDACRQHSLDEDFKSRVELQVSGFAQNWRFANIDACSPQSRYASRQEGNLQTLAVESTVATDSALDCPFPNKTKLISETRLRQKQVTWLAADDLVYLADGRGWLRAMRHDGTVIWQIFTERLRTDSTAYRLLGSALILAISDGRVIAVDRVSGRYLADGPKTWTTLFENAPLPRHYDPKCQQ